VSNPSPNCRLTLPNPTDAADPANLAAIAQWANNYVVNQVVNEDGVGLSSQTQAQGPGAQGSGIVTVPKGFQGYASLTGPGETTTPGELLQTGPFGVLDASGGGIAFATAGTASMFGQVAAEIQSKGTILLQTGGASSQGPITIQYADLTTLHQWSFGLANPYTSLADVGMSFPDGSILYTNTNLAALPTPPNNGPAWALTEDGNLYFYAHGGSWALVVGGGSPVPSPATSVTGPDAFGASAVVGTSLLYARGDHDHGLPANPVTLAKLETLFTANLQILMGTGVGTGALIDLLAALKLEFGQAGQLIVGTGAGTGELLNPGANTYVLTSNGTTSVPSWQALPAGVSPATSVTGPDAFGASAVVGTSLLYARQDHDHGLPAESVTLTNTVTLTNKRITRRASTTAGPGGTPSMDTDNYDVFHFTALAAAITSMTTNLTGTPVDGDLLWVTFTDNGTARAIAWGTSFEASTVVLPTTTVISTRLDVLFAWNTVTSKWRCIAVA